MTHFEKKVEINASVKKVWEALTDMERYPKWQIDKKEIKELEPNKYLEKTTSGDYIMTITESVKNKRMLVKVDHPVITGVTYNLNEKGDITELSFGIEYMGVKSNEKIIARGLEIKLRSFKKYVEYLEDGGDPDDFNVEKLLIKP